MAVTVYFKNSGSSTSQGATKVKHEVFPESEESPGSGHIGIALYDDQDRLLGRFLRVEIVGYVVHGALPH